MRHTLISVSPGFSNKMEVWKAFAIFVFLAFGGAGAADSDYNFTPEEQKVLERFRTIVGPSITKDFMKSDGYLMRYLRSEGLNLERAKRKLDETLAWRKEENIDDIASEDFSSVDKCLPVHWLGQDREGRPVLYMPVGRWDIRRCALAGLTPKMTRYLIRHEFEAGEERVLKATHPSGARNVSNFYGIVDLANFNIRQGACLRCIPFNTILTRYLDRYYLGCFHRVSLINVPRVYDVILNAVRPFLTGSNTDIIATYGHDKAEWLPALGKDLELDQLPVSLGGKRRLNKPES